MTSTYEEQIKNQERWDYLTKRYGSDMNIYGISLNALMDRFYIDPSLSNDIKRAVVAWKKTNDYADCYPDSFIKQLKQIDQSENMTNLCYYVCVTVACKL